MKLVSILLLISLILIKGAYYPNAHYLTLDDSETSIDGELVSSSGVNGVKYNSDSGEVRIKSAGTYIITGRLTGQLEVNVGDNEKVTLVLNGVKITCSTAPAIIFKGGYEFYTDTETITYEKARSLDFSEVGAKIIIADDSINTISGSHTDKNDGAISSKISLAISGEEQGNGVLNIIADYEGIEVKNHILIEGGIINIASQDDGINIKEDSISVCLIKGGQITINAGLGNEGDGIDSNGYLIIEGGTVISASKPMADSGLDSNLGFMINGGRVVGVGTAMDGAESEGTQPAMNLKFAFQVTPESLLRVTDIYGKEIFSFSPSSAGFMSGTELRNFTGATISSPDFKLDTNYNIFLDDVMLGNGGSSKATGGFFPGPPPGGDGGDRPGPPPGNHSHGNHSDFGPGGPDFSFDPSTMFSGCDDAKTMNSTVFEINYNATTFSCIQKVE